MARGGRRRRVLNEEARATASHLAIASREQVDATDGVVQRYGQQAHVENHPQITDFIPRRKRRVCLMLLAGTLTAVAAQAIVHYRGAIAAKIPGIEAADAAKLAAGLTAWTSAAILAAAAVTSVLVHSLRRHRVDDVRGRYRVWKWAAVCAAVLSVNAVVRADRLIATAAVAAGWSFTSTGVEWQIVPLTMLAGLVAFRMTIDLAESRGGLASTVVGLACYVVGVGSLLASGAGTPAWATNLFSVASLVGHTFVFAGMLLYARYVVLDVQGLIDHQPERFAAIRAAHRGDAEVSGSPSVEHADKALDAVGEMDHRTEPEPPESANESARWIDGSEQIDSEGEDEEFTERRKLTKAQRKKLRKQKMQRRAA